MKNEFGNRQNMHLTIVALLANPEHQPVWQGQKPVVFTTRAAELLPKVAGLTDLISSQQADIAGHAADKEREEKELETVAHEIGKALAGWFEDQGREAATAPIDLSLSAWQRLRDPALLAKAMLLHKSLTGALMEDAASLADYGLDAADATLLSKETADFERIIADPAAATANRRVFTLILRPKFREVGDLLAKMDRLVLRFRSTESGKHFVDAWKAARNIRDLGISAPAAPAATPNA